MGLHRLISVAAASLSCLAFSVGASQTFFGEVRADWNHFWKYEPSNTNLAPYPWTTQAYDDSAWISGPGIFASPPNEILPPGRTNLTTVPRPREQVTVYFRTTFTWTRPEPVYLTFSNLLDDGAVFYLNGIELRRFWMPTGALDGSTLAVIGREAVDGYDVFVVENPPLVAGINILAAEVHQSSSSSGDVVFGCYVRADQARPPCGWQPPTPQMLTVLACTSTNLGVSVSGYPVPKLQWFKDGVPIPDATNAMLSLTQIGPPDQGTYLCRESNSIGTCELGIFTVTVVIDDGLLYLEQVVGLLDLTQIRVQFSMRVDETSAVDIFNYYVEGLEILSAELSSNGREVLLTTQSRIRGQFYAIEVMRIESSIVACGPLNFVLPYTRRRIDLETIALPFDAVWKYHDAGVDLGMAWREPAYDDSAWSSDPAMLGFEDSPTTIEDLQSQGLTLRTPLNVAQGPGGNFPTTYYFRAVVNVPFSIVQPSILRHVVDDGAVFYVNGAEAGRFNMPAGPIDYNTLSVTTPPEGVIRSVPVFGLTQGTNLLAVEVHQNSGAGGDVLFGAQLTGIVSGQSAPRLQFSRAPGNGGLILSWPTSAILEETSTFPSAWSRAANQSNPQTIPVSEGTRFYRVRW
jgi:Immunoglobulin I-set domain